MSTEVDKAYKVTVKALKKLERGYFYYVGIADGTRGVLLIHTVERDPTGRRTLQLGKRLRTSFREELELSGTMKFSFGEVVLEGKRMKLTMQRGQLPARALKLGLKNSEDVHAGLPSKWLPVLKRAKIVAEGDADEALDEGTREQLTSSEEFADLRQQGLTESEALEVLRAERGMRTLQRRLDRELKLQLKRERGDPRLRKLRKRGALSEDDEEEAAFRSLTEARLARLQAGGERVQALVASGELEEALALEQELDGVRDVLAVDNAHGPDPFADRALAGVDRELYRLQMQRGLSVVLRKLTELRDLVANETARVASLDSQTLAAQREAIAKREAKLRRAEGVLGRQVEQYFS